MGSEMCIRDRPYALTAVMALEQVKEALSLDDGGVDQKLEGFTTSSPVANLEVVAKELVDLLSPEAFRAIGEEISDQGRIFNRAIRIELLRMEREDSAPPK